MAPGQEDEDLLLAEEHFRGLCNANTLDNCTLEHVQCLQMLVELAERHSPTSAIPSVVGRSVFRLVTLYKIGCEKGISDMALKSSEISETSLRFVWQFWHHSAEVLRNETRDIFEAVTDLILVCRADSDVWLQEMTRRLVAYREETRQKFRFLLILARRTASVSSIFWPCVLSVRADFSRFLLICATDQNLTLPVAELYGYVVSKLEVTTRNEVLNQLADVLLASTNTTSHASAERFVYHVLKEASLAPLLVAALHKAGSQHEGKEEHDFNVTVIPMLVLCASVAATAKHVQVEWRQLLASSEIARALLHFDTRTRLSAWQLLCDQKRTTLTLCALDLTLARLFITANINEQQPSVRQKVLSGCKKLLVRIRDSAELLLRTDADSVATKEVTELYEGFLRWFLQHCFDCLCLDGNFGRKLLSISIIDCFLFSDVLRTPQKCRLTTLIDVDQWFTSERLSLLLNLLDDAHELIQESVLLQLKSVPHHWFHFLSVDQLKVAAFDLATNPKPQDVYIASYRLRLVAHLLQCAVEDTNRSDDVVFALVLELTIKWRQWVLTLGDNDNMGLSKGGLHGLLHCINDLLETVPADVKLNARWRDVFCQQLIPLSVEVSRSIAPVLHSASPEGYTTQEAGSACVSQTLVVNCWRCQREISRLFGFLSSIRVPWPDVIGEKEVRIISDYFLCQLTECKHRGAFETAFDSFCHFCKRLWSHHEDPDAWNGPPSPAGMLQATLDSLTATDNGDALCATRRSAGVPFLIAAILISEPPSRNNTSLMYTFDRLFSMIADPQAEATQRVHALNVLRSLLRQSAFGAVVWRHCARAFVVIIDAFSDGGWATRNAASLAFAALIVRVFGVPHQKLSNESKAPNRNCMGAVEFFTKFPQLRRFLWLKLSSPDVSPQCVFAVAALLGRLRPSSTLDTSLCCFVSPLFRRCVRSSTWQLRAAACDALCAIVVDAALAQQLMVAIGRTLSRRTGGQNEKHGCECGIVVQLDNCSANVCWCNNDVSLQSSLSNSTTNLEVDVVLSLQTQLVDLVDNYWNKLAPCNKSLLFRVVFRKGMENVDLQLRLLQKIVDDHEHTDWLFQSDRKFFDRLSTQLFLSTIDLTTVMRFHRRLSVVPPWSCWGLFSKRKAEELVKNSDFAALINDSILTAASSGEQQTRRAAKFLTVLLQQQSKFDYSLPVKSVMEARNIALRRKSKDALLKLLCCMQLSTSSTSPTDQYVWKLVEESARIDRPYPSRRTALECCRLYFKNYAGVVIPSTAVLMSLVRLLQDESCDLRDAAARLCSDYSSIEGIPGAFCPTFCLHLLLSHFVLRSTEFKQAVLEYRHAVNNLDSCEMVDGDKLFDSVEANTYLERFLLDENVFAQWWRFVCTDFCLIEGKK